MTIYIRVGRRDVDLADEVDVDGQRVAAEIVVSIERLYYGARERHAHGVGAEAVFVFVDDYVALAVEADEYAARVQHVGQVLLVQQQVVILAVDVSERRGVGIVAPSLRRGLEHVGRLIHGSGEYRVSQ